VGEFNNKIVWITGASSGIGKALASAFSNAGANIVLSGRRIEALEAVAENLKTDALVLPFEVTEFDRLEDEVSNAWGWKGRIDILINNAGVSQRSLAIDTQPHVYTELINIDLIAPIWLTQLQLQRMAKAGGGHIVAISSVAGRFGPPLRTAYAAAKHGLIGYMDSLRTEVEVANGIHVTNVLPGSVATDISRNAMTLDGSKRGKSDRNIDGGDDPADCASAILDAVSRKQPELIFAKGMEQELTKQRHDDPNKFFEASAKIGAAIAQRYTSGTDD
jgi:short-subunit dehydrogenase